MHGVPPAVRRMRMHERRARNQALRRARKAERQARRAAHVAQKEAGEEPESESESSSSEDSEDAKEDAEEEVPTEDFEKMKIEAEEAEKKQAEEEAAVLCAAEEARQEAAEAAAKEAADGVTEDDANAIREAMKGWGTDEKTLISILATKTDAQMTALVATYAAVTERDMVKDLKSECGGDFEDAVVALTTPLAEFDAAAIRAATKGLGTDEQVLAEILGTRTPDELAAMKQAYKKLYDKDVLTVIEGDVSGDLQKLFLKLLSHQRSEDGTEDIAEDVQYLYDAGEGKVGSDDGVFIRMLAGHTREYCEKLYDAYATTHGKALDAVIKDEISGSTGKCLAALVTPLDQYFSLALHTSMAGAGTRDKDLIRLIVSQRTTNLKAAAARFLSDYKKTLKVWVEDECGGNYERLLVALCENFAE